MYLAPRARVRVLTSSGELSGDGNNSQCIGADTAGVPRDDIVLTLGVHANLGSDG